LSEKVLPLDPEIERYDENVAVAFPFSMDTLQAPKSARD
jgi:hypothetical protein